MASTPSTMSLNHLNAPPHHSGKRLRQFVLSNGRRLHIVSTPEEHERVRRTLSAPHRKESDGSEDFTPEVDFDIVISGSPEHRAAIRDLHEHHTSRKQELRERHGTVYDEFEKVTEELDALEKELGTLNEHGIALSANFGKFGYAAHLRSRDSSHESPTPSISEASSLNFEKSHKNTGERISFWKMPVVRQYMHKGLLWRASASEEVASFELFVDLLYVGIIAVIGDAAAEDPTALKLLHSLIVFTISWKIWNDLGMIVSWFETDDIVQRLQVLFVLICLFGFTINLTYAFDNTYTALIAFYTTQRFWLCIYLLVNGYLLPMIRGSMVYYVCVTVIGSVLWIASIYVEWPNQLALIFVAAIVDLFGYIFLIVIMKFASRTAPTNPCSLTDRIQIFLRNSFAFFPAINIEHRTERVSAFVTLVLGSSVLGIIYASTAVVGLNAFFAKAILSLILAFSFNWIYFECDTLNMHMHAIRRHWMSSTIWSFTHMTFVQGFVLAAGAMKPLVLAHDTPNANVNDLGEAYRGLSEREVKSGNRWFYSAGLGVALLSTAIIAASHIHRSIPHQRLRKPFRLWFRCAVAVVLAALPAKKSLNSLDLMAIATCLVVLVLAVELVGSTCTGESFFCPKRRRGAAGYTAHCRMTKRDLEDIVKEADGGTVDVEEVGRREKEVTGVGHEVHIGSQL